MNLDKYIEIPNPFGSVNLNRLSELENQLNKPLPEDYREYILKYNGGFLINTAFKIEKGEFSLIHNIYRLTNQHDFFDLINSYKQYYDIYGENYIVIADDNVGNHILLGLKSTNYGQIYFAEHEQIFKKEKINDSFIKFLEDCKSSSLFKPKDFFSDILDILKKEGDEAFINAIKDLRDINATDKNGYTIIERAIIDADLQAVNILLKFKPKLERAKKILQENYLFFPDKFSELHKVFNSLN